MSRVCVTRTSRRTSLIPTRSAHVTYRNAFVTQPAYLTAIPYTTCSAVTIRSTRTCSSYRTTRVSTVPREFDINQSLLRSLIKKRLIAHIETVRVPYTVTVQNYVTSVSTYYSTTCSTVRGYTAPTPTTRTVTVVSTTTDSTDSLPMTVTMVSTITDSTDTFVPSWDC